MLTPLVQKLRPRHRTLPLKTKLQLSFVLIGLFSIGITGWQAFENARTALESITFERLTSIREIKKRQIESYFQQIRYEIQTLAENRAVVDGLERLTNTYGRIPADRRRELLSAALGGMPSPAGTPGEYFRLYELLDPVMRHSLVRFGYDDILLVDVPAGDVVYSVARHPDFATNLFSGPYRGSSLALAMHDAVTSGDSAFVRLVDFAPSQTADPAPVSFVAAPVYDAGRLIGAVILRISITAINRVMTSNNNWKSEGLGETGETYIVGSDFRLRTDSRFFIQEPETYMHRLLRIGTDSALVEKIRTERTSILLQEVRTESTLDAMKGNTATRIANDYRGIPVVSSYSPLVIPGVRWVIIAEIDVSEAFNSILILRERLILLGFVILFIAATGGIWITRIISKPILSLARASEEFGRGNLDYRADVAQDDEIGHLAATFTVMAESIRRQTGQLEAEIAERKRIEEEVKTSRERLRNLSGHLQTVREEERKGLAREIHDELGQALTILKLNLTLLQSESDPGNETVPARLSMMLQLVDATIQSVKRLITALRPLVLDDLGLTAAIEWQADEFQERTGIPCEVSIIPADITVDPDRSIALFRILQETLTNIARHAGAGGASVFLRVSQGDLVLTVSDNGRGMTPEEANDPKSFGLIGIRERADYWGGNVDIDAMPGHGTAVTVRIPVQREETEGQR